MFWVSLREKKKKKKKKWRDGEFNKRLKVRRKPLPFFFSFFFFFPLIRPRFWGNDTTSKRGCEGTIFSFSGLGATTTLYCPGAATYGGGQRTRKGCGKMGGFNIIFFGLKKNNKNIKKKFSRIWCA